MKNPNGTWKGSARTHKPGAKQSVADLSRRGGIVFFWVLNDHCDRESLTHQLNAFQKSGIEGLILHPRNGLLLPYGGDEWFELIHWLVDECLQRGIEPILYDEDPYPSGSAGGRIVGEHPEYLAYGMEHFQAPDALEEGELFLFPLGRLCWAGIVFPDQPGRKPVDLTARVGTIRRHWEKAEWNSRWYYPGTPVYPHPRAFAHHPEFGLRCPKIPDGGRLCAFVARPVEAPNEWGNLADSLNPRATHRFLQYTHERYRQFLKEKLGSGVFSIFTDEPKPPSSYSWTPGLFEDFEKTYHYDLRQQLHLLFTSDENPAGMRVRMDYREWITRRFNDAWLKPVARWCHKHRLSLIGHLSPEEDPVNQSATLGNIFPTQKHLLLGGYDLIIPAIGDAQHALLNVGPLIATSAAQQNRKPGVCCESLGAFGLDITMQVIGRVLAWQILHGATLGVIHGAFSSQLGLRRYEAPADYGVHAPNWNSIREVYQKLTPYFQSTLHAKQEAPVAILWPIRSFQALGTVWEEENAGLRQDLLELIQTCLEHQVGIHLIDEEDLSAARLKNGQVSLGRASYQWILLPSLKVLGEKTLRSLEQFAAAGVCVAGTGEAPAWQRLSNGTLKPLRKVPFSIHPPARFRSEVLPRLPTLLTLPESVRRDFHATVWKKGARRQMFLMHVGKKGHPLEVGGETLSIEPGELLWLSEKKNRWCLHERFSPADYSDAPPILATLSFEKWEMQIPGKPVVRDSQPLGAWQILPTSGPQRLRMITTGEAYTGGGKVAESIVYRTRAVVTGAFEKAFLLIEPTLLRGRFTLEIEGHRWQFQVADTGHASQKIDVSQVLQPNSVTEMQFTLHEPEALDGIKHSPRVELS